MPAEVQRRWTAREVRALISAAPLATPRYQRNVPDDWIVDLDARLIERWWAGDDRPELVTETLSWHPAGATTAFELELSGYFESVFATD
jgi:hypothetical protein